MTNKKIPLRQCVGCREMKPKRELLRIIRTTEQELLLDTTGKKSGRGAYICPNRECLNQAVRRKGIERSLGAALPQEICQAFEKEIAKLER